MGKINFSTMVVFVKVGRRTDRNCSRFFFPCRVVSFWSSLSTEIGLASSRSINKIVG